MKANKCNLVGRLVGSVFGVLNVAVFDVKAIKDMFVEKRSSLSLFRLLDILDSILSSTSELYKLYRHVEDHLADIGLPSRCTLSRRLFTCYSTT